MGEQRSGGRLKSFLKGQIVFNNRMSTMDCIIRNISATGAKLAMAETVALPDQFDLVIPHKGETLRARLKWRGDDEIGVVFISPGAAAPPDLAARVRELEAEVEDLRARLAAASRGASAKSRQAG